MRKSVETIVRTTESAANLTRQLLSFSRKHAFSPQVLDLNVLVNRMSEMLLGVLRDEMEFVVKLDPDACCINADPGQVEQVIMNLVVNARDAMPNGGTLTLETAPCRVQMSCAAKPAVRVAARRLCHAVGFRYRRWHGRRDSEQHLRAVLHHQEQDEGTGLGLSVVYNIVRGSGGHVRVSSEPGSGSTLQVFFPRVATLPPQLPVSSSRSLRAPARRPFWLRKINPTCAG